MMPRLKCLQSLLLSFNALENGAAAALAQSAPACTALLRLELLHNSFGGDAARAIVAPFAVSPGVSFVDQARDRRDAAEMQCAAPHAATPFPVGAAQQRERRADSP